MRFFLPLFLLMACGNRYDPVAAGHSALITHADTSVSDTLIPNKARVIHVYVALCDNKNQGIVPVPAAIGNGQDPANNLYWGCAGGVKGYFKKHANWQLLSTSKNVSKVILERCVFKHKSSNAYIVADAYDGAAIKSCTIDFFHAAAGRNNRSLQVNNVTLGIGGSAQLIAYTGHDGLMDFSLPEYPARLHDSKRETIILACISKRYFRAGIQKAGFSADLEHRADESGGLYAGSGYCRMAA